MGQAEVMSFLRRKRMQNGRWFCAPEIRMGLKEEGFSDGVLRGVDGDLLRLAIFKMIQWRGAGWWKHKKEFRGLRNAGL